MLTAILVALALVLLPLVLFFGLIGLALFVWSWRRVGPYFVDFGRWMGNWRNYVPCGCLLFGGIVSLLLIAVILPQELDIFRIILLVVVAVIFAVCSLFAATIWTVRVGRWFWARFRKGFWEYLERLWNLVVRGMSGEGRAAARRPAKAQQQPVEGGATRQPTTAARLPFGLRGAPKATIMPPTRRSPLGVSSLWAVVWGRSREPVRKQKLARGGAAADVQKPAVAEAKPIAPRRVPASPKAGLRPLMWRLGMLGKPRSPGLKRGGVVTPKEKDGRPGPAVPPTVPDAGQPRLDVAAPAARAAEAKPKPTMVLGPKPERSPLGPIRRLGRSIGGALEGLRKGFWAGVFWTVGKAREGVDSILRLLHLGGRRK